MTADKEKEILDAIAILNSIVRVRIAPSKIHGVGIFAINDIKKGTKLYLNMFPQGYNIPYEYFRKLKPEVRDILLERWANIVNGSTFMYPDTYLQAYMNHQDKPNYNGTEDITLVDIKAGEEVTESYKDIKNWEKIFPWLVDKKKS